MLETLETAGSALTAQRLRMDVIASNLANSEATSTPDGGPYKRERVVFGPVLRDSLGKLSSSSTSIANGAASGGLEVQVVELALAIAEKVVAREARIDPSIVLNVVRSALSEVHHTTELRIHVNPDDAPLLENRRQEMLPRSVAERSELVPDDLVERGGVLVETRIGYADSQLKTRLNHIVTTFQAVLDGEPV